MMTSTAQFYTYELQSKVDTADPRWLADLLPETMLDAATELKTALVAAGTPSASGAKVSEAQVQERLMAALSAFVAAASDEEIFVHDTHLRDFLRGLSPDVTGTAKSTKSAKHVTALLVALLIDFKKPGKTLNNPGVKGQAGQYAIEVIAACPVDGPFTVAVMNDTHVLFLRVSSFRDRVVWESGPHSWTADGVQRMYAYVRECVARLAKAATWNMEWFSKYVPVEYLGSGISARTLAVHPRPASLSTTGATTAAQDSEAVGAAATTSAKKAVKKKASKNALASRKGAAAAAMDDGKDDGDEVVKLDVTYAIKLFDSPAAPTVLDAARSPAGAGAAGAGAGAGAAAAGCGGASGGGDGPIGDSASTVVQTGRGKCL
jgi:hypothetical protein